MMDPANIETKIGELQILESHLQQLIAQKQAFQVELNEITNALGELSHGDDDVYRIISGIMVKSDRRGIVKDLEEKKRVMNLRISSLEKQEEMLSARAATFRKEITGAVSKRTEQGTR